MLPKRLEITQCSLILSVLLLTLVQISFQQHIFEETCEYKVKINNNPESLRFASQVHNITSRFYDVYINFCKPLQNFLPICDGSSQVCIIKKQNKRNMLKKPVVMFESWVDINNITKEQTIFMKTNSLGPCQDGNYQFTVRIDKTINENEISYVDNCLMEIKFTHPDILLRDAAFSFHGLIIDLTPLKLIPQQILTVNTSKIALAAFHPAESCRSSSRICEITQKDKVIPIADVQHVLYDDAKNQITIRGRKTSGKGKIKSELLLRCNWSAIFENPRKQLANYKYTIDSKFGCVKTPLNCTIVDIQNYKYDLSSLDNPLGWIVKNTSNTETMKMNICGVLKHVERSECSETYSQVCSQQNGVGGHFVNYGSLHNGLKMNGDDIILTYSHGSLCATNSDEYLSTSITFQCFSEEFGPVLSSFANCTAKINWRTPAACTKGLSDDSSFSFARIIKDVRQTKELSCSLYHNGQMFRFGRLISNNMTFESRLVKNRRYFVNICQPIAITRENFYCGVTGACIDDQNEINLKKRFKWIGSLTEPKIENDEIIIRYEGGLCQNSTHTEIVITFNCSKTQEPLKLSKETVCCADFIWNTPLACKHKVQRSLNCNVAVPSGEIIDFGKIDIRTRHFHVEQAEMIYDVDLCSDNVLLLTNSTQTESGIINTTRYLIEKECQYSMIYKFTKKIQCLESIKVNLLCNEIDNNPDHLDLPTDLNNQSNCPSEFVISLKSSYICDVIQCNKNKKTEIQKDTEKYTKTKDVEVSTCKIVNTHQNKKDFYINDLKPLINKKTTVVYTLGSTKKLKTCDGFVCKNNLTLATLEICPSSNLIQKEKTLQLFLMGPSCNKDYYKVKLNLHCASTKTEETFELLKDEECSAEFQVETNDVCVLFDEVITSTSQGNVTGYILGILSCLIVLIIAVLIWKYRLCTGKLSCRDSSYSPTQSTLLYVKND